MVKMGNVWDRTVEVLNGRTGMIATLALLGMFVPSVVRDAYVATGTPGTASFGLVGAILSLVVLLATIWAQLAIIAVATHPATTRDQAGQQARARLAPAFGITMLIGLAAFVAMLPPVIALVGSGFDFAAAARGATMATNPLPAGAALFVIVYFIALAVFVIWAAARLVMLNPVILNERLGLGAFARAFALSRGLSLAVIGVVILFGIVVLVATGAAQAVTGVIVRLAVGASGKGLASFLGDVAGTLVTTACTALSAVFTAQLYVAATGEPTRA